LELTDFIGDHFLGCIIPQPIGANVELPAGQARRWLLAFIFNDAEFSPAVNI
jgi:hypothetical protein